MVRRTHTLVGASLSATIATLLTTAVLYAGIVLWALIRVARVRRIDRGDDASPDDAATKAHAPKASASKAPPTTRPLWTSLAIAALWIATLLALVSAAFGYVAFAQFVASQIVWIAIVSATCYLVVHLIEDIFATLVAARATWMQETLGVRSRTIEQVAVVLSGAFRVVAFLFALSLVLTRFGNAPGELLSRGGAVSANGFSIGSIEVTPTAIAGAIFVFLIGILAIRTLQRWLHDRYLPTTSLDPAMRSSVTTLLGYAGMVVVVAFALSELGLSVERIAWVASALSVGIGFGLQAVVQNFVSGLILLAERPVKVGDWVALGDVEGDIRRISVRATEIQMGDRSTLIVPNSELITKTVRNVTLANAQGRVMVKLPMPLDTDADKVMTAMREAFQQHSSTLSEPAPSVTVDGIQANALVFSGVAFIDNPRKAGGVRSELILDVLARLRAAGVAMVAPQEVAYRAIESGPVQPIVPGAS